MVAGSDRPRDRLRDRPFPDQVPLRTRKNRVRAAARRQRRGPGLHKLLRRVSAPVRALPDFLIIGAQKAGTTSLFHYLSQHPGFARSYNKEPGFLHRGSDMSLYRYRQQFPLAIQLRLQNRKCYEATPESLYFPQAPLRARKLPGRRRFVAVLREPAARAISHYGHLLVHQRVAEPFERFLDMAPPRDEGYVFTADDPLGWRQPRPGYDIVARGIYDVQLARWFDAVGRDAVHVVLLDELVRQPQQVLESICDFLETPAITFDASRIRHRGFRPEIAPASLERLRARFAEPNARLADLLERDLPW